MSEKKEMVLLEAEGLAGRREFTKEHAERLLAYPNSSWRVVEPPKQETDAGTNIRKRKRKTKETGE